MQHTVQGPQVHSQPQPVLQRVVDTTPPGVRHDYACKAAMVFGILQILTGVLCIIFQVTAIALGSLASFVSSGIWCGILFIVTGAFGIASSYKKSNGFITTFMVLSILSAVFILALVAATGISLGLDVTYWYSRYYYNCRNIGIPHMGQNCGLVYIAKPGTGAKIAMNALLQVLAICELVFAICSSVLGCKVFCCSTSPPRNGTVLQMQYVHSAQPQVSLAVPGQALVDQHGRVLAPGVPTIVYPSQPILVRQNGPVGYTAQAFPCPMTMQQTTIGNNQQPAGCNPPMFQQQVAVTQPPVASTGRVQAALQNAENTKTRGQGSYVKLEEDI